MTPGILNLQEIDLQKTDFNLKIQNFSTGIGFACYWICLENF